MIKLTATVYMYTKMDKDMKEHGRMICKMDMVKNSLKMVHSILDSSLKERSMAKECIIGKMELFMMVNGL